MAGVLVKFRVVEQWLREYETLVLMMRLSAFTQTPFLGNFLLSSIEEFVQVIQLVQIEAITQYDKTIFFEK